MNNNTNNDNQSGCLGLITAMGGLAGIVAFLTWLGVDPPTFFQKSDRLSMPTLSEQPPRSSLSSPSPLSSPPSPSPSPIPSATVLPQPEDTLKVGLEKFLRDKSDNSIGGEDYREKFYGNKTVIIQYRDQISSTTISECNGYRCIKSEFSLSLAPSTSSSMSATHNVKVQCIFPESSESELKQLNYELYLKQLAYSVKLQGEVGRVSLPSRSSSGQMYSWGSFDVRLENCKIAEMKRL